MKEKGRDISRPIWRYLVEAATITLAYESMA
jgi:hypothetical protein